MSQTEKLTDEDVHDLLGAIDVAEGETGGDYSELKNKLFTIYPQVKKEIDEAKKKWDDNTKKQDNARKEITDYVFERVVIQKPILTHLKEFISIESNYDLLTKHYSDEICLSADLWRYHKADLKKAGLFKELRDFLKAEAEKPENYWMRDMSTSEPDSELWHTLVRQLEKARRG